MNSTAYGFARPISLDKVKPGMLLAVQLFDGERVVAVGFETDHDAGIIVLWSNRGGEVPRALDYDGRWTFGLIEGEMIVEPDAVQDAFFPPVKLAAGSGLTMNAEGDIGVSVLIDHFGTMTRAYFDLATGKRAKSSGGISSLQGYKLSIAQNGRKDPWPLVDLIP